MSGIAWQIRILVMACSVGLGALVSGDVFAQQIPPQANPGLILQNLQQQTTAPARQSKEVLPLPPNPTAIPPGEEVELELPSIPASVQLPDVPMVFHSIQLEGNTLLPQKTVQTMVQPYLEKIITVADLTRLVEAINEQYEGEGYITSIAFIPTQEVNQGTLTIAVQEGKVGNISVQGNRYTRSGVVLEDFGYHAGDYFNLTAIEAKLTQINQQGHYQVKAVLSPGANPGETDIQLEVSDKQPWQISPSFDNQGIPQVGMYRWGTQVANGNLLGIKDPFSVLWLESSHTQQVVSSYTVPVSRFGDRISALFAFSHADLERVLRNPPINGTAYSYALDYAHPLDKQGHFVGDVSFNAIRTSSFVRSDETNRDDFRVLRMGLNFQETDRLGSTLARVETSLGAGWLGGNQKFWKATGGLSRIVRLPLKNWLLIRGAWQLTPDALGIAELITIGGNYTVRGYSEQLLFGDRGYRFSVEHRWPIPFLSKISPWLSERVQGDTFVDLGQVWFDRSSSFFTPGESNRARRTFLIGVGFGARAQLTRFLTGFVDCAFGLVDRHTIEPDAQPTARVHFGIRSDLLNQPYRSQPPAKPASSTSAQK